MSQPLIKSWSYSRLTEFEKCPYRLKLKVVDGISEPSNKYSERGIEVHSAAEAFVKGETPTLHPDLAKHFKEEFGALRTAYAEGRVSVEQEWAYDRDWNPVDWKSESAWLRLKLDACVTLSPTMAAVVDFKTGKLVGNEVKHAEQGQLYAGVTFLRNQALKEVTSEFWYLDQNDMTNPKYTAPQAAKILASFDKRARKMTEATSLPPKPSIFSCKWCPYRAEVRGGNGACEYDASGVQTPARKQFR